MKKNKSPRLILKKLILVGREKNYIVPFNLGLNIIYGDSDTGKSSILNIIDYLLGASEVYLYDEIEVHGKYGLLELELNGDIYTIKRDIFNPRSHIEVYHSSIEQMEGVFPKEYSSSFAKEGPAGFFSDFMLEALNISLVKLKQAPSKADSKMSSLSFRDILKFCFLDQDDVGNKDILDQKNPVVFVKNKETFKFLHNLLDSQITELQEDIAEKTRIKNGIIQQFTIISSFLREAQLETTESLEGKSQKLSEELKAIDTEIFQLTHSMKSNSDHDNELREIIVTKQSHLDNLTLNKMYKETQLDQNLRLKRDYQQDIDKLLASVEVIKKLPNHEGHYVNCPVCDNELNASKFNELFSQYDSSSIELEIKSLKNRFKEVSLLIERDRESILGIIEEITSLSAEIIRAKDMLDLKTREFVSPFMSQRDLLNTRRGELNEENKRIDYLLKLRNQLNELTKRTDVLTEQISQLNSRMITLVEGAPSVDGVLGSIADWLNEFLTFIPIRNPYGIKISDKTFLPVVRDRDYSKLTSGGLRTLVSIGYLFSLLRNSLNTDTNYPSLVMIDTVGKYIGKTKAKYLENTNQSDDKLEGINDPKKYKNIYSYLSLLSDELVENYDFQVIVVDNDLPESMESQLDKYIVKKFSADEREGFEIGFINNASPRV
ncbi:hypothetical protein GC101_03720 [Paenibacillus sp. LMG 31459]|uniref:Rad50/SbcC-type AAA domain-containing protein n=1 Tax=Paenibacillus phytohabitans TaxID=2654978 RepID=A0ABX1YAK3_9BACL|nr:hypothetical protein [Paenibacillus phytohabitans]NOU77983.1 hypothetical protein [Paenibacillus phytohabitans]